MISVNENKSLKIKIKGDANIKAFKSLMKKIKERRVGFGVLNLETDEIEVINKLNEYKP